MLGVILVSTVIDSTTSTSTVINPRNQRTLEVDFKINQAVHKYIHLSIKVCDRMLQLVPCENIAASEFDGVVVVTDTSSKLTGRLKPLCKAIDNYRKIDISVEKRVVLLQTSSVYAQRLIFSPTGPLSRECENVRCFYDAAGKGIKRARVAGCKKPLLVVPADDSFPKNVIVSLLGALHVLYMPHEVRETPEVGKPTTEMLGVWSDDADLLKPDLVLTTAFEMGRIVARDIGSTDPESMAPPRCVEYILESFKDTVVQVDVVQDVEELNRDFPLLAAVNRASNSVDRHQTRLVFLEYVGDGETVSTLFMVGQGITCNIVDADIKAGGIVADKCGAATVAGFFKVLSELKPPGLKVVGGLPFVCNSVGEEYDVTDEIITSRSGERVRVGNTDAQGGMVMADVLCKFKDMAAVAVNPHLFTIATSTENVIRAVGADKPITMDNGPAAKLLTSFELQRVGNIYACPFEISTIGRDDYDFHKGNSESEDILQCSNSPSTQTLRGHHCPAAFLIMASGLDKHENGSDRPLPYSHIDVTGSSASFSRMSTVSPIIALAARYILPRLDMQALSMPLLNQIRIFRE